MLLRQLTLRRILVWVVYVLVMIAVVVFEYAGDVYDKNCGTVTWNAKLWHQRLCLAGHRKPRAHYVRLVTITAGHEYSKDAHCDARKFVSSLLLRLRDLGPALIVVDKYYKPSTCKDPVVTATLQKSITDVSSTVPIVLGQSSDKYQELLNNNDPDINIWQQLKLGQEDNVEVLSESAISVDGTNSQLGLVRLACSNWEIPLRWTLYPTLRNLSSLPNKQDFPHMEMDTLPFVAAKKFDPAVAKLMSRYVEHHDNVVGAFLPTDAFQKVTATQVLCGLQQTKYDPLNCKPGPPEALALRGKIVVVGEYSDRDSHQSVIGKMPGFLLQANYIESLLDDRYYQQIPKWLEISLAFLCLVLLEITMDQTSRPHTVGLWWSLIVVGLWALSHFAIMEWGSYFTFWFPLVIAVPIKWVEAANKNPRETHVAQTATGAVNT